MEISEKLEPLFELLDGIHPTVDTVIISGGRLASKSYGVSTFVTEALVQHDWSSLYTRFTNVSGQDSTVPEVQEKIDLLNYSNYVHVKGNRIGTPAGAKIVFKGLKAGSGTQSANLKSLKDFNLWVNDESEEIPDYDTFRKIFLSIRHPEKRNLTILILNPTVKDFWIHEKFFEPYDIPDFYNGIRDNVMYIHTCYLDVPREVIPDNIFADYERMKLTHPDEYEEVILGTWITAKEGALYNRREVQYFDSKTLNIDNSVTRFAFVDVADEGEDSLCMVVAYLIDQHLYIVDVIHTKENSDYTIPLVAAKIKEHKLDYCGIETNGMGAMFFKGVQERTSNTTKLLPIIAKANKHGRIIGNAHVTRQFVKFSDNYEHGSDYDKFMRELFAYTKDGKVKHDDAPDAVTGLVVLGRELYG